MRHLSFGRCAILCAAPLLGGCFVDPCGGVAVATMLVVETSDVSVQVGESVRVSAFDSWCSDQRRAPASATWRLVQPADTAFVRLDPRTGIITGRAPGHALVSVTSSRAPNPVVLSVTVH